MEDILERLPLNWAWGCEQGQADPSPAACLKAVGGPLRQRGMKQRRILRMVIVAGPAAVPRVVPGA